MRVRAQGRLIPSLRALPFSDRLFGHGLWTRFLALHAAHPAAAIRVTGHSLGGALGTLFTAALIAQGVTEGPAPVDVEFYSFGSPRVGDAAFVTWFNERLENDPRLSVYRLTHHRDPVPSLPPKNVWYRHVAHEVNYKHEDMGPGAYKVCNGSGEDPTCHDYYAVTATVSDHSYWGWTDCDTAVQELS